MISQVFLFIACVACLAASQTPVPSALPGSSIIDTTGTKKLVSTGPYGSQLYEVAARVGDATYGDDGLPRVLNLTSNSYEAGFDTGFLLAKEYHDSFMGLIKALLGDEWWEPLAARAMCKILDKQYTDFLGKELPDEFNEEFRGLSDGGKKAGYSGFIKDIGSIAKRGQVMANLPSTLANMKFVILNEHRSNNNKDDSIFDADEQAFLDKMMKEWESFEIGDKSKPRGFGCSMIGAWGSRTVESKLFTGRNLDWMSDTGVAKHKLIIVHHPEGGYAHAEIGWSGLWGSIAGMSEAGLTMHEANLESNDITFEGFGWILRLRYIMEKAKNHEEALTLWNETGNTVGFNHGIGSANDGSMVVLETMWHSTAVFKDMDPRESDSALDNGDPRPDSVWRTNHGYDPYTQEHYMWNNSGAYTDSQFRYNLVPPMLDNYEATNTLIGPEQMVNLTAILGGKGIQDNEPFTCNLPFDGHADNVLSIAFSPNDLSVYAAYESGTGDGWIPAACNTYLKFDMTEWF
jgi:hypothetical protein